MPCEFLLLLSAADEVDVRTFFQGDIRFFPVTTLTKASAGTFGFAFYVHSANAINLNFKQLFYRCFNLWFSCVFRYFEHDSVSSFCSHSRLFRNVRSQNYSQQTFFAHHDNTSSICFTASAVIKTFSKAIKLTGSRPCTSRTSTLCKLRAAKNKFSSTSLVTIRTSFKSIAFN